ncbi:MAG: hypothetical protein SV429_12655, partial [Pseudomonadota bacterium]|nr:hypothetical protein [Pseudomonadota bacterium]
ISVKITGYLPGVTAHLPLKRKNTKNIFDKDIAKNAATGRFKMQLLNTSTFWRIFQLFLKKP